MRLCHIAAGATALLAAGAPLVAQPSGMFDLTERLRAKQVGAGLQGFGAPNPVGPTEWRFDVEFETVGASAGIRYLDDIPFGEVPGGGPAGITEEMSVFAPGTEFGLPLMSSGVDPRVLCMPGADSRGIGLLVWPNSFAAHPTGEIFVWTIIMDILIPDSSWDSEIPAALINFDDNNGDDADFFIFNFPPRISNKFEEFLAPLQPDRWHRLVFYGDRGDQTVRVLVDGTEIGIFGMFSALKDRVDPDDPTYANGIGITADEWASWGEFPNPWAVAGGAAIDTTFTLFSDDDGEGESLYVSGVVVADEVIPEQKIADIPDDPRIVVCDPPCPVDIDCDCDGDTGDLLEFLSNWFNGTMDYNGDRITDIGDLLEYLSFFFAGC